MMGGRRSNRSPLWRLPVDWEVDEELQFHLEMRTREYRQLGLDQEEAARRALARFGDPTLHASSCRQEARGRNRRWRVTFWLEEVVLDVKFGIRQLCRRPTLAVSVVGLLAVGLAATTAVAVLLEQALFQPPPFGDPAGLMTLWEHNTHRNRIKNSVSPANFVAWREETSAFERISGFITTSANLIGEEGPPLRLKARIVTEGYFDLLGIPPVLGRTFQSTDHGEGAEPVVVLSHRLWLQRFGGRRDLVGQMLTVDGEALRVIGVVSSETSLDMGPASSPYGDTADVFSPLTVTEAWRQSRGRWLLVLARLAPGVTIDQANGDLARVMARQVDRRPKLNANWASQVIPLLDHMREPFRLPLMALFGAVSLLLLIVCLNASSLVVGRTFGRVRELAVRNALGAGTWRLVRQILVEGLVVVVSAGVLAWPLSRGFLRIARASFPAEMLPAFGTGPAGSLWLVGLSVVGFCVLLFGLLPGLTLSPRLRQLTHVSALGSTAKHHRLRALLVFGQVVLALMLLVGAGLMLRTVQRLVAVDPGFESESVVSFSISARKGLEDAQVFAFYDELLEMVQGLPDVMTAGAVTHLPMASLGAATSYYPADQPEPEAGQARVADIRVLRGDYLGTLGIPVSAGRAFDSRDHADSEPGSILVSRSLAELAWPGESAIGREVFVHWGKSGLRRVVGVVGDVHHADLMTTPREAIYFPQTQEREGTMSIVLRSDHELGVLGPELRRLVSKLDASLPIFELRSLSGVLDAGLAKQRFLAALLGLFAMLALGLAALGIYGITTLSVSQSTREIGLRMALGASPRAVAFLFVKRVAQLTGGALMVGLAVSILLGRAVESLLFEVRAFDPATLSLMALLLGLAALVAAFIPARRASRMDPTVALRWD